MRNLGRHSGYGFCGARAMIDVVKRPLDEDAFGFGLGLVLFCEASADLGEFLGIFVVEKVERSRNPWKISRRVDLYEVLPVLPSAH